MRKKFPDEARVRVSHDKPKNRVIAAHDIAAENVIIVLQPKEEKNLHSRHVLHVILTKGLASFTQFVKVRRVTWF